MTCSAGMGGGVVSRCDPVCGVITAGGFSGGFAGGGACCCEEVGGGSGPTCWAAACEAQRKQAAEASAGTTRIARFFCHRIAGCIVSLLGRGEIFGRPK